MSEIMLNTVAKLIEAFESGDTNKLMVVDLTASLLSEASKIAGETYGEWLADVLNRSKNDPAKAEAVAHAQVCLNALTGTQDRPSMGDQITTHLGGLGRILEVVRRLDAEDTRTAGTEAGADKA